MSLLSPIVTGLLVAFLAFWASLEFTPSFSEHFFSFCSAALSWNIADSGSFLSIASGRSLSWGRSLHSCISVSSPPSSEDSPPSGSARTADRALLPKLLLCLLVIPAVVFLAAAAASCSCSGFKAGGAPVKILSIEGG